VYYVPVMDAESVASLEKRAKPKPGRRRGASGLPVVNEAAPEEEGKEDGMV
jgi:hypothetical protein